MLEVDRLRRRRDDAHLQVLESMIVALLLLGAAYAVLGFHTSEPATDKTRADLKRIVSDAVGVMGGLRGDQGRALDADILSALHCASDAQPSETDCIDRDGANLTMKLATYLPTGAAFAVTLSNGLRARDIYRTMDPPGEAVSSTIAYAPDWNLTFTLPELSCYDPAMDVNATMLPLVNGAIPVPSAAGALDDHGALATAKASNQVAGAWNVTLPHATRPSAGAVTGDLTSKRGSLPGVAHYDACGLSNVAAANATVAALRLSTLAPESSAPQIGSTVVFHADLTPLAAVAGATIGEARLVIEEPLPERPDAPDSWIETANVTLPAGNTTSYAWAIPANATFGVHPVVLSVNVTIGGTTFQARLLSTVAVALENGIVPIEPPYRVALQVWFRDWH